MRFYIEEMNLIALYHSGNRINTILQIKEIVPEIQNEKEIMDLFGTVLGKLEKINDREFDSIDFDIGMPLVFDEE